MASVPEHDTSAREEGPNNGNESATASYVMPLHAPQPLASVGFIPTVQIEMAGTPSPTFSSGQAIDHSLLSSPEHHRFISRSRSQHPPRPSSAPATIITFDGRVASFSEQSSENFEEERHISFSKDIHPGDLIRPSPLLFRPTTFWRKLPQSGVRGASYSPSAHVIRRSTFVAAGLSLDKPVADISAFGVESRVGIVYLPSDTGTAALLRRQNPPGEDVFPTTSINWWPFPASKQSTSLPMLTQAEVSPIPTSMFAVATTGIGASTQSLTIPTLALPASLSPSPESPAPSSTASLIQITALPPATTSTRRYRHPNRKPFKIVYLTPLFAVLAAAVGVVCAWIFLRWYSRKRDGRRYPDSLQPGPEYRRPSSRQVSVRTHHNPTGTARGGASDPVRAAFFPLQIDDGMSNEQSGGWFRRMLSSRKASTPQSARAGSSERLSARAEEADEAHSMSEFDPFLDIASPGEGTSAGSSTLANTAARSRSFLTTSFLSPDPVDDENDWAEVPYDTLRHNSIRQSILNRLNSDTFHRNGHKRTDSDLRVEDVQSSSGVYSPVSLHDTPTRSMSRESDAGAAPQSVIKEIGSAPGFRIVEEDISAISSLRASTHSVWNWPLPWSSGSKTAVEDRLTAMPSRKAGVEKRKSPSLSPVRSRPQTSDPSARNAPPVRSSEIPRIDSSVLPSSPPRLMSPHLEAKLFFGPIAPNAKVDNPRTLTFSGENKSQDIQNIDTEMRKTKKLRRHQDLPLLPFPSGNKYSSYRNRLSKRPPNVNDKLFATASEYSPPRHPLSYAKQAETLEQDAIRCAELDKVQAIIAESWTERDLRGVERLKSPTLFGALMAAEQLPLMQKWSQESAMSGIEERLTSSGV